MITILVASTLSPGCALRRPAVDSVDAALDARILREVQARLALEPVIATSAIRVEVREARVHLHGSVAGFAAWRCAIRTAALAEDVRGVIDFLLIGPGPSDADCRAPREVPLDVSLSDKLRER